MPSPDNEAIAEQVFAALADPSPARHPGRAGARLEWLAARLELLGAEKELTRRGDEVARRRQALP